MIRELFPSIMYEHDIVGDTFNEIQKQISNALPRIRQSDLVNPWSDTVLTSFKYGQKNNICIDYKMPKLIETIIKHLGFYTTATAYNSPMKFSQSWINFNGPGTFQYPHHHAGSKISGTYYYQTNGNDGKIVFENPNPYIDQNMFPSSGFNNFAIDPKPGKLILFPSWMRHGVELNKTDHERISISFNID